MSVRAISSSKNRSGMGIFLPLPLLMARIPALYPYLGKKAYFTPHPMGMNSRVYSLTANGSVIPAI